MIILILILSAAVFISNMATCRALIIWSHRCGKATEENLASGDYNKALINSIHAEICSVVGNFILGSQVLGLVMASIIGAVAWAVS